MVNKQNQTNHSSIYSLRQNQSYLNAADRGPAPRVSDQYLRQCYEKESPQAKNPHLYLCRMLANPLGQPLSVQSNPQAAEHQVQPLRNLLRQEPAFPNCTKAWLLNRITNPSTQEALEQELKHHGQSFQVIPFLPGDFLSLPMDLQALPYPGFLVNNQYHLLKPYKQDALLCSVFAQQITYVFPVAQAKNTILSQSKIKADWILPWNSQETLNLGQYQELYGCIESNPWYPYLVVPAKEKKSFLSFFSRPHQPGHLSYCQLVFNSTSTQRYSLDFPNPLGTQVELLWRLGIPGVWDHWKLPPWGVPVPPYSDDAGAWKQTSSFTPNPDLPTGLNPFTAPLDGLFTSVGSLLLQLITPKAQDPEHPDLFSTIAQLETIKPSTKYTKDSADQARIRLSQTAGLTEMLFSPLKENPRGYPIPRWILKPSRPSLEAYHHWLFADAAIQQLLSGFSTWSIHAHALRVGLAYCLGTPREFLTSKAQAADWLRLPDSQRFQDTLEYQFLLRFTG